MKNVALKIIMSTGEGIPIDSDEMPSVISAIQKKTAARLRRGFFNPPFFVSIVRDDIRHRDWVDAIRNLPADHPRRLAGPEPLKDLFADMPLLQGQKPPELGGSG